MVCVDLPRLWVKGYLRGSDKRNYIFRGSSISLWPASHWVHKDHPNEALVYQEFIECHPLHVLLPLPLFSSLLSPTHLTEKGQWRNLRDSSGSDLGSHFKALPEAGDIMPPHQEAGAFLGRAHPNSFFLFWLFLDSPPGSLAQDTHLNSDIGK